MSLPLHPPSRQTLVVDLDDATEYLEKLGISVDDVRVAIERGEARAAEASGPEYPRTGAGLSRWIETVGALRRALIHQDWIPEDRQNRPICVNPGKTVQLGVLGGTVTTGDASSEFGPQALRRKGRATDEALGEQLVLHFEGDQIKAPDGFTQSDPPPPGVWFLVYHRGESSVQVEVSHPTGSTNGQIDGWNVRIILPPFTPDADVRPLDVGGGDVGFDVNLAS